MTPGKPSSAYVDMKPGVHEKKTTEAPPYMDMRGGSSPAKPSFIPLNPENQPGTDYMDMDPRKTRGGFIKPSTSPSMHSVSPLANHPPQTNYMDMNCNKKTRDLHLETYSVSPTKAPVTLGSSIVGARVPVDGSPMMDYMDMHFLGRDESKVKTPSNEGKYFF